MTQGLLSREAILERIRSSRPLVEGAIDLDTQVQPNGIDLTLRDVARVTSAGEIDFSNQRRSVSATEPVPFDPDGAVRLGPGAYLVTLNEIVNLPLDLAALGRTRSSLLRSGVALHTAVWDAGYSGRSQSLMTVYAPDGVVLHRHARILQLVFLPLSSQAGQGYRGAYLGENIEAPEQPGAVIYHLLPEAEADSIMQGPSYLAPTLATEGFMHASATEEQLLWVANTLYRGAGPLAVLCIDPSKVRPEIRYEQAGSQGQAFPHVYGPLNMDAVVGMRRLRRGEAGTYVAIEEA